MVLRFKHMIAHAPEAQKIIISTCRDLANDDFVRFGELRRQFSIMRNLDVYVADDMDRDCAGYIFKCLRSVGILQEDAEIIVPNKIYLDVPTEPVDAADEPEPDEDNIVSIEDLLPDEAFDDGHFWDECDVDPGDDDE
jgi:hypothetical protein